MSEPLLAMAKEVDITPPVGIKLEGYIARQEKSCGIHDPLMATVLIIKKNDQTIALISLDTLALSAPIVQRIREAVSANINVPVQNVLVACTHTHSGPAGLLHGNPLLNSESDTFLEEMLVRKISGAACWAYASLKPAVIRLGHDSLTELGKNRNSPESPQDSQLTVMMVEDLHRNLISIWANFGCHPTVLGSDNLFISADFPGEARQTLKRIYPDMVWLFTNGASGDISTRFTRKGQGFDEVRRFGHLMAGSVMRALQLADPLPIDNLGCWIEPISIPYREFPPQEKAEAEFQALNEKWNRLKMENAPAGELRIAQTRMEGAQAQLLMAQFYGNLKKVESEIQLIQIGNFAIISLPGEPFTQTVLDIKKLSPFANTCVVSYGNDYLGYFPDEDSVNAGTYEALVSPFLPGAAEILRDKAVQLLNKGIARES